MKKRNKPIAPPMIAPNDRGEKPDAAMISIMREV